MEQNRSFNWCWRESSKAWLRARWEDLVCCRIRRSDLFCHIFCNCLRSTFLVDDLVCCKSGIGVRIDKRCLFLCMYLRCKQSMCGLGSENCAVEFAALPRALPVSNLY